MSVANRFLNENLDLGGEDMVVNISEHMAFVHEIVNETSQLFFEAEKRSVCPCPCLPCGEAWEDMQGAGAPLSPVIPPPAQRGPCTQDDRCFAFECPEPQLAIGVFASQTFGK